ncbi:GIY-YIG nuclease family protein [Poriferisphaera corsica]|uniref:GIY-YIG nuclease family protein n=1 Tax=Poriferisphaera corsica TaxID=2528020 RepID=UPI0011A4DF5A|nr:GIY-YIG nuclease family protein [Poriferisphaera corsica]
MKLLALKQFEMFDDLKAVRVLRHRTNGEDLWQLYREGQFHEYQDVQRGDIFKGVKHFVGFIAERGKYARFVGVWEVLGGRDKSDGGYRYKTREVGGFEQLKERLVVCWEGTRSWAQRLDRAGNKEVSEILPRGYVMDFPGHYDFVLQYDELVDLVKHPNANREWHRMLSSIAGVYLILDKRTGEQYVGCAYGVGGIWGRWRSYAKNGSRGNKGLKALLKEDKEACNHFQFTILRVLEPSATKDEVLRHEGLIKKKLGSRAFGLNFN